MKAEDFIGELRAICPLVLTYCSDQFQKKDGETPEQFFARVPFRDYWVKRNEGFKLAQDLILKNVVQLENDIAELKNSLRLPEQKQELEAQASEIHFQIACFKELTNCIVWLMQDLDQPNIKILLKEGMQHAGILNQQFQHTKSFSAEVNKDPFKLAIMADLTSIVGVGDVLVWSPGRFQIVECKQGDINKLLHQIIESGNADDPELLKRLEETHGRHAVRQLGRMQRQIEDMDSAVTYMKEGGGEDLVFRVEKQKVELKTPSKDIGEEINAALNNFYKNRKNVIIASDCVWFGIFNRATYKSDQVCIWDFKHYLFHERTRPWDQCQYLAEPLPVFTKENPPEFSLYQALDEWN